MPLQHSLVAYISESADDLAVIDYRLDDQRMGPRSMIMYPEKDLDLCRGNVRFLLKDVD